MRKPYRVNGHPVPMTVRIFVCPCGAELPIPQNAPDLWTWSCRACGRRGEANLGWQA